jgi:uncharacterized coiled-coil protein SlyX
MNDPYDEATERAIIADLEHVDELKRELAQTKAMNAKLQRQLDLALDRVAELQREKK